MPLLPHVVGPVVVDSNVLALIPGLPLLAFAILILIGRRLGAASAWISVAAMAGALAVTYGLVAPAVLAGQVLSLRGEWLLHWRMGFHVDELSLIMLVVVTTIGTLIQLYSIGYMHGDARYSRFFAYLSLFCASMLGLAMADHLVLFFACWELMGLCSYLLISFWFEKPAAANAGLKAFLTTRIGDTGLLLGILLLALTAGTLEFHDLGSVRMRLLVQHQEALLTLISLLIFSGSVGKSAQIPLHVWLPDAMEGPTPVSALIHAATMVAAGVYLVARTLPLFTAQGLAVVLGIGLTTHLLAGTVALTMTDIKRILAYSTISQLGLMFVALGLGSMPLAMFHLVTHACFKALLFLGAGSIIHATHQQDLSKLGGLFRSMPVTGTTCLIATLAMSGVPFLSGFWSKDAILIAARRDAPGVFWCLLVGAVMTAAYIFRLYLRCFHGAPAHHGHSEHPAHESPAIMTAPLALLAIGAAGIGFLGSPFTHHWLFGFLKLEEAQEGLDLTMLLVSGLIAGLGAWLAWEVGVRRRTLLPAGLRPLGQRLYGWAAHKYYVDECYREAIVQPFLRLTQGLSRFDQVVIDGAVNRTGSAGAWLSRLKAEFDRRIVDGLVNAIGRAIQAISARGRQLQTGIIHHYLLGIVASVVLLALWLR